MSEYIVGGPFEYDDVFVANMGAERTHLYGYELREEIVRCQDCAFAYRVHWPESCDIPPEFLNCHGPLVALWDYEWDRPKDNPVEPDGYCKWGKRRDKTRGDESE